MLLSVRIKVPAPPVHDQSALLNEFGLVDVSGADVVAFFVAHLPFNGGRTTALTQSVRYRPSSGSHGHRFRFWCRNPYF